jgi:hypothetical protein
MESNDLILIEVAYALPHEQVILEIEVAKDCVVEEAIKRSGILERYPEIDLKENKVGIFGKMCKLNGSLYHKDRIEIYRPLIADPKESRRQKAEMEKKKKAAEEGKS